MSRIYMSSTVQSLIDPVLKLISKEIKKKETRDKIMKNVIDPLFADLSTRYYPYFIIAIIILFIIVVLLIAILILTVIQQQNK
jgi:large-conductance mechanosensitive channel